MAFPSRNRDAEPTPITNSDVGTPPLPSIPPDDEASEDKRRVSSISAGYMELEGAQKDGDCEVVEVEGGVSKDLGCSNLFEPIAGATSFTCGTCTYFVSSPTGGVSIQSSLPKVE